MLYVITPLVAALLPLTGELAPAGDEAAAPPVVAPVTVHELEVHGTAPVVEREPLAPVVEAPAHPSETDIAAARAETLGLGTRQVASRLLVAPPLPEWVEAVQGKDDGTLLWPVDGGRMGRGVGYVRRAELRHIRHDGVDIPAPIGTEVRAAADGLVAYSDRRVRGFGNLVILVHGDGSVTLYAHLNRASVVAGQRVRRGQTLGEVGNTGFSHGPHLHFEWRVRGWARNPVARFEGRPASEPRPATHRHDHRLAAR